ncbi:MAG: Uncharacterised protein [Methanobacteriota archaeon]|nr:MAG: Uncharacterised protein [Euryarchaeota archaeon]
MNPANGGTPANESMNMNIEVAIKGSLRANPDRAESLDAPPSISKIPRTRKAPNLNTTRTAIWKITAPMITVAKSAGASMCPHFQAPTAVNAASMYPA